MAFVASSPNRSHQSFITPGLHTSALCHTDCLSLQHRLSSGLRQRAHNRAIRGRFRIRLSGAVGRGTLNQGICKDSIEGLLKCFCHHDTVTVGNDDPRQGGQAILLGLEI